MVWLIVCGVVLVLSQKKPRGWLVADGAIIVDRAYFEKPEWLGQSKNGGFSRGMAWLDLLAITNQKATVATVRGISMNLERGECAYSKLGLSIRWGRSQNWVNATLSAWEEDGRIQVRKCDNETTVIFLTNFDAWQKGMFASLCDQNGEQMESKRGASGEQLETEREKEKEKYREPRREGEGGEPPRLFTLEAASKLFGPDSGYTPDQVREQWLYYDAMRDPKTGDWQKPRGATGAMTRITDPRSELAQALLRFAQKKSAPTVSASVSAIQIEAELAALEDEIHQDRASNLPRDPKKTARVRELRDAMHRLKIAQR